MTDEDKAEVVASTKFAAQIAEQIVAKADDGTKFFAVTYHYPKGWNAVGIGFAFTSGMIGAVLAFLGVSRLLGLFIEALR